MTFTKMLQYHKVESIPHIPTPESYIIKIQDLNLEELVLGNGMIPYVDVFYDVMEKLEPYPIFIKTDSSAQKKSFKKTCRLPSKMSLLGHLLELFDLNITDGLSNKAIIFRKWIDLDANFTAFDGLPIGVEGVVSISNGNIQDVSPSWNHDMIENATDPNWKDILIKQNELVYDNMGILKSQALKVAETYHYSTCDVEFALGRDGKWYMMSVRSTGSNAVGCYN